jgi:GTP-binding protein
MSFVDKVLVSVVAGDGGNGKMSFRQEKFVDKGGPDGGDGGNGGDVVLCASRNQDTLATFRYQKEIKADSGRPGGGNRKHGRSAKHLFVQVPVGTVAINNQGQIIADLIEDGQQVIIAKGGKGGFGNAHFVSSRRQAPKFAEKGEAGIRIDLTFELKMIADVGLVGLPNAGKSTLLSKVSNARPEIADYPFTTLTPNLGVVDIDKETSVLIADIPGLIEGAAEGKGLGHDFLRHIERTAVILHLIDAYNEDVVACYKTIRAELKAYSPDMIKRPEIVAITKVEGLDDDMTKDLIKQLKKAVPRGTKVIAISSLTGENMPDLKYAIKDIVLADRVKQVAEAEEKGITVLTISDTSDKWEVISRRTNFDNEEAVQRLRDIMRKTGILHDVVRKGVEPGQMIQVGPNEEDRFEY